MNKILSNIYDLLTSSPEYRGNEFCYNWHEEGCGLTFHNQEDFEKWQATSPLHKLMQSASEQVTTPYIKYIYYEWRQEPTPLQLIHSTILFCWNEINSENAREWGTKICGECWAYKFEEITRNYSERAWATDLLYQLPEEQANQLMQFCYEHYKEHKKINN